MVTTCDGSGWEQMQQQVDESDNTKVILILEGKVSFEVTSKKSVFEAAKSDVKSQSLEKTQAYLCQQQKRRF